MTIIMFMSSHTCWSICVDVVKTFGSVM